jgi:hypothetical protein
MLPSVRHKVLSQVSGLEDFENYVIDIDGNVWSYKNRKPRIMKPHIIKNGYLKVALWNRYNKRKHFYIHRLVAFCFLPKLDENDKYIIHKNNDLQDNRLENLEWNRSIKSGEKRITLIRVKNDVTGIEEKRYQIDKDLTNKIEKVFYASQRKGLPSKNNDQFFTELVNNALDDYVRQYGLHKIMNVYS